MDNKKVNKVSATLNLLAGVLFILAAFHIITGEQGIDYLLIFIGVLFLVLGIAGWLFPRPARKP